MLEAPWNRAFIDELAAFPLGQHDDQVDALSLAFSRCASKAYLQLRALKLLGRA